LGLLDLDLLVEEAWALEPLPASVGRLVSLVAVDGPDLDAIVGVIEYDQALTTTLLRHANSALSGAQSPISSVRSAVIRVGTATVMSLAIEASVVQRMSVELPEYGLSEGELWRHSVASWIAASAMARFSSASIPEEAPTAALLHDIGKLLMARFLDQEELALIERACTEGSLTRLEAEREILGVHHGELGGLMAQHWGLPEQICKGISYHHTPDEGLDRVCYATHLANVVAKVIGTGQEENADLAAYLHSMEELAMSSDSFEGLCTFTSETLHVALETYP
jgi:putative nucleotidyltransferase with HDIG domain